MSAGASPSPPLVPTAPLDADRFRDALVGTLRAILTGPEMVAALAPYLKWEYIVAGVTPGPPVLISGTPVNPACPFGPLANITLWRGPAGSYAVPVVGSKVVVEFHDGSPAKPAVAGLDPTQTPTTITLGTGVEPIAISTFIDVFFTAFLTAVPVPNDGGAAIQAFVLAALTGASYPGTTGSTLPVLSE